MAAIDRIMEGADEAQIRIVSNWFVAKYGKLLQAGDFPP